MADQPIPQTIKTLGDQSAALTMQATLAMQHPGLPGAYFVQSSTHPDEADALLGSLADVEVWRSALAVPPSEVDVSELAGRLRLEFAARLGEVSLRVYATGVMPPLLAGRFAEQRHRLEDPAVPPLPGAWRGESDGSILVASARLRSLLAPQDGAEGETGGAR